MEDGVFLTRTVVDLKMDGVSMNRSLRSAVLIGYLPFFGIGIHEIGFAQAIKQVHVFAEGVDEEDARRCSFSIESMVASAEAALRFNRVAPTSSKSEEVKLYINSNIIAVPNESRCVYNHMIQFKKYGNIRLIQTNRVVFGDLILCESGRAGIFPRTEIQSRANEGVRTMVDICISQIEREAK